MTIVPIYVIFLSVSKNRYNLEFKRNNTHWIRNILVYLGVFYNSTTVGCTLTIN